ncbi:TonB-dependent receptor [Puniceicoccaceae bacterium K14]|nr:TonB-dependent receptor [Puniceicoccaceae bacterium K14]
MNYLNNTPRYIKLCLIPAAMVFSAVTTYAQTDNEESGDVYTLDDFVVSGTRTSLAKARDIKMESRVISDTIVAEDIAKFPDLNLAESLQRIAGVAINREAGEGRRVTLRGLGPDFTRVQLNGMEVLGNVDSPQDSRGQGSRDRAFDFNIFASELFNRVEVKKSYDASQTEGGLAGTIGLITAKPFDYGEGVNAALSVKMGSNTLTGDLQPRTAFQVSNTWGETFGALISVAYSERDTDEQGTNTFRWRPSANEQGSDISALPAETQAALTNGELRFARGNRISSWQSHQERLGITSAFQWRPTDELHFTLDILHGEFTGERDELHLNSRGANSSSWLGGGTTVDGVVYPNSTINELRFNENGEVVFIDVSGGNNATETRRQLAENEFDQLVLTTDWQISDALKATILLGTEKSTYDIPISDKFYLETFGDVTTDYTLDPNDLTNTYGFDPADPTVWRAHEIDFEGRFQETTFDNAKIDLEYTFNDTSSLKFGLASQEFFNSGFREINSNVLRSDFQSGAVDDDISEYYKIFTDHEDQDWTIVDFDAALETLGVTRSIAGSDRIYEVEESTNAAYVSYLWETKVGGKRLYGDVGVRGYETDVTSSGVASVERVVDEETGELDEFEERITVGQSYDGFLPTFNATLELKENLLLRLGLSQNINRPSIGSLAVNGDVSGVPDSETEEFNVEVGNPGLEPYESDNIDLSLEWYFGDIGTFAVGYFFKDITGLIGTETVENVPFSETGVPLSVLDGLTPDSIVDEFSRPINHEDTTIEGIEFSFQSDLDFLPGPLEHLGFVGNLTFVDGELDYAAPGDDVSLIRSIEGLSDVLGNATFYYETDKWGARASANYRSGYVARATPIGNDEDGDGFNSTVYVDFSAFYQLNHKLKLTFDVINITDQREEQYSDLTARRHYNSTSSGTTFFTGINYKF